MLLMVQGARVKGQGRGKDKVMGQGNRDMGQEKEKDKVMAQGNRDMGQGKEKDKVMGQGNRDMGQGKVKDFYDLEVWKRSHQLTIKLYKVTEAFPKDERFGLIDQMRRAISSVSANIAEGFNRYHPKDKSKFYYNARASISESKSHILLAKDLQYIQAANADLIMKELAEIEMMLNGLISSIRRLSSRRSP
jgi:four helix bundle protein